MFDIIKTVSSLKRVFHIILSILLGAVFFMPNIASANLISSQNSNGTTSSSAVNYWQTFIASDTSLAKTLQFYIQGDGSSTGYSRAEIYSENCSYYSGNIHCTGNGDGNSPGYEYSNIIGFTGSTPATVENYVFSTPFQLTSGKIYTINLNTNLASDFSSLYSSDVKSKGLGSGTQYCFNSLGTSCGGIHSLYYDLYDTAPVALNNATNYINITSPTQGQTISNFAPVHFTLDWNYLSGYNNLPSSYDKIGFALFDINTVNTYSLSPISIVSGTPDSYTLDQVLTNDTSYSFKAFFYDSSDSTVPYFYSTIIYFSVGGGGGITLPTVVPGQICNPPSNILDVGGGIGWSLCQLFAPQQTALDVFKETVTLMQTKIPFSYVSDVSNALNSDSVSSGSIPSLTINLGPGLGNTNTVVFDNSTLTDLAGSSNVSLLRGLIEISLWLAFGFYVFKRTTSII